MFLLFLIVAGQSFLLGMHDTRGMCIDRLDMFQEFAPSGQFACELEKLDKPVYEMGL
jgi:hypothetical protein